MLTANWRAVTALTAMFAVACVAGLLFGLAAAALVVVAAWLGAAYAVA